eukprot:602893-Pyramimonas_sp.AAC.1
MPSIEIGMTMWRLSCFCHAGGPGQGRLACGRSYSLQRAKFTAIPANSSQHQRPPVQLLNDVAMYLHLDSPSLSPSTYA